VLAVGFAEYTNEFVSLTPWEQKAAAAAPRVYYAMARDGLFFRWCARVHPRFHTPYAALLVQGTWAIVLVAAGTYEQLLTYVIFAAFVFYALTALAVMVLRRTMPDAPRPYRVFGYPYVPIIFVLGSAWFLVNTLMEEPVEAGCGALMLGLAQLSQLGRWSAGK
jgi:APA family basic amino acid/polyamine antiporter